MTTDPARASMLARAFLYPYGAPDRPVLFDQGQAMALPRIAVRHAGLTVDVAGFGLCAPVLAVGSNASVQALRRKFGSDRIGLRQGPVRVPGFAKVHSAHVARYGAMPATFIQASDVMHAHLQLVPVQHLQILDASEAVGINYDRIWLNIPLRPHWLGVRLPGAWAYRSRHGPLRIDEQPVALTAQARVLAHAAKTVGWTGKTDQFVENLVRESSSREAVCKALA